MLYYRYRSGSELAMKELIYDELYFASKGECNDPYEGKIFAVFDADQDLWSKIICEALTSYSGEALSSLTDRIVAFFVQISPIYVDEVLASLDSGLTHLGQNDIEIRILKNMSIEISKHILVHRHQSNILLRFQEAPIIICYGPIMPIITRGFASYSEQKMVVYNRVMLGERTLCRLQLKTLQRRIFLNCMCRRILNLET